MDFDLLNPFIRNVALSENIGRVDFCISYDSRLIYLVSGDIAVQIEDEKRFHLQVGNMLFIPAGVRYKLKGEYFRAVVISLDLTSDRAHLTEKISPVSPEKFDKALAHTGDFAPFDKPLLATDMESERDNLISLSNVWVSAEGNYRAEISARVKLLLLKLAETVSENALPARMVEGLDSYIRENCRDEISNTELGAIFGYHPFYISRLLKEKKGITLRQYIISYRLKASCALLINTKKSVAEIAEEVGFKDASYFTKTFRQVYGETPKDFRNKFKEDFI